MTEMLVAHGTVVTMDSARRVIEDGGVAIRDSRIVEVGDARALRGAYPSARLIDARHKVVMPGLLDCHGHAGHGLVKTLGAGDGKAWYAACERIYTVGSSPEFWHAEAQLSALERLKCGTTCGVSLLGGGADIMRTDEPLYGNLHCEAVEAVGIRSVVAVGACRPPFPRTFARWRDGQREDWPIRFEDQLATSATLIDNWHGKRTGRVSIHLAVPVYHPTLAPVPDALLAEYREQARAVRQLGTAKGVRLTQDGHRSGSLALARAELDMLGDDVYVSHCVDLTPEDITAVRETGTHIVHNPSAVMSILGRCPVPELIEAGVNVALGSDGTAPDRSSDMFRHMFQCMHYHRTFFHDPSYLPPGKVLEMATIDAARALGLEREIGSLEAGKKADLIVIDMRKPHLYPLNMVVYRIPHYANGADVDTVIVDGRVLMEGRRVLTVDEAAVLDAAQQETELMLDRTGFRPLLATPARFWGHAR
jgi:5-methylthioadenosine/S-adenosylhomocysteine deaminase